MIERINLIPDEIRSKKKAGQRRPLIVGFLIVYVILLGTVYYYQKTRVKGKLNTMETIRKEKDELMAQNARYRDVIERINQTQKREDEIRKRLVVISAILDNRIYWSEILKNITHTVPDGVWLTSMSTYDLTNVVGKGVKFSGTAISNSGIAEFVFALENSRFFGNILLSYTQKRELNGRDLYDFEITADLKGAKK